MTQIDYKEFQYESMLKPRLRRQRTAHLIINNDKANEHVQECCWRECRNVFIAYCTGVLVSRLGFQLDARLIVPIVCHYGIVICFTM